MAEGKKIFIVEDERRIARFLQMELEHAGFVTEVEENGRRAYERIIQGDFDLVLLDIMLPEMDGLTICRKVRELSDIPIIMLTARDEIDDKVQGLDIGADDYVTKPFAIPELFARMRVALRKPVKAVDPAEESNEELKLKNITMNITRREVMVDDTGVELTKKEFDLLEYLIRNKRNVLTRDQILSQVWGYDYMGDTNVVDVYIRYLRAKLDDKFNEKYIYTMRGVGYVVKD
ncbi:MAG: response regulator transcription factor [Anaerovibrio sp.]|uniref:response regulator transcription factor n=1 Tax=Anaerovibrio sp. TaxID=1872532 RepID=UPI0025DA3B3E|nr:response regulator transcription factor [Anaerovibrio sp.]MCR5176545.1 response regulator transcription factor [Anaerovibrio sp.]